MENVVEIYLENLFLFEDITYISEDVASFLKKLKPEKYTSFVKDLKTAVKSKNIDKIGKVIQKLRPPRVPIDKVVRVGQRMSGDFSNNYKLAKRVLDNSLPKNVNDDMKKSAAFFLSFKSIASKSEESFKTVIRKFVEAIRFFAKKAEKVDKEVPTSTLFEGVIGWLIIIGTAWLLIQGFLTFGPWGGLLIIAAIYVLYYFGTEGFEWLKIFTLRMDDVGRQYVRSDVPQVGGGQASGPQLF